MRVENYVPNKAPPAPSLPRVRLSAWVNERYLPIHDTLSAHDVSRLKRRPRWMLAGLCLVGRFPKKARFRGRALGWRRTEVLEWMARDLAIAPAHFSKTKTASSRRTVEIPPDLRVMLKEWRPRCPSNPHNLVCPSVTGRPMQASNLLQVGFVLSLARAGIRRVRFHDLRPFLRQQSARCRG